jgi:hypothetical protein
VVCKNSRFHEIPVCWFNYDSIASENSAEGAWVVWCFLIVYGGAQQASLAVHELLFFISSRRVRLYIFFSSFSCGFFLDYRTAIYCCYKNVVLRNHESNSTSLDIFGRWIVMLFFKLKLYPWKFIYIMYAFPTSLFLYCILS